MDNMITCPSCGAALPQGTKHCTECGAKLDAPLADAAEATAAKAEEAVSEAEAVFGAPFAQQPPSVLLGDAAAAVEGAAALCGAAGFVYCTVQRKRGKLP